MQLGFVSAILPDLSLEEVFAFARDEGFDCVEVMCWPTGAAERRYAGVTHLDVRQFEPDKVQELVRRTGVSISSLGYYPNPLAADADYRRMASEHIKKVIDASRTLGLGLVTTFLGRDHLQTVEAQWPLFEQVWKPLVEYAAQAGVKIAIENCPMLFSNDEWPGGKNLGTTPEIWRRILASMPGDTLGLNFDPSHLVWQFIDTPRFVREFGKKFYHVHAKDARIDHERLYERGIMGLAWHTPKIPGLGDVPWGAFFSALTDAGYNGPVCIEVEDRAYERSLEDRKRSLRQSKRFLQQFIA